MIQISEPTKETIRAPRPPSRASRRGLFARIGAVTVGAAAASILSQQKAALAYGPVCCNQGNPNVGACNCGCSGASSCCWYCLQPPCSSYECCDKYCGGTLCTCAFKLCNCC